MTDDFDGLIWAYRAVFKQTAGGGGSINVNIVPNERIVLLYGLIGNNDYAANRTVTVRIQDEDDNNIGLIMSSGSVDNTIHSFPQLDHSVVVASDGPDLANRLVLGKGDSLLCIAATLVQNEELTVAIRALFRSWPPTVTTTGSGGTVTTTVTYDKVI